MEIPRTGEMAWSIFIASSKFLLKDSSVVLGLSKMYRELVIFDAGVVSFKLSFLVISGVSLSICISVHIISSEEQSDGSVSGTGFWLFCGVTIGWSWPLTSAVVRSTCATRQGTEVSAICAMGIASPSLVASALFLCLDDRRISGDFCCGVAFMSIRFAADLSGDGVFSFTFVSDESEMDVSHSNWTFDRSTFGFF